MVIVAAGNSKTGMDSVKAGDARAITYQSAEGDGALALYSAVRWFSGEALDPVPLDEQSLPFPLGQQRKLGNRLVRIRQRGFQEDLEVLQNPFQRVLLALQGGRFVHYGVDAQDGCFPGSLDPCTRRWSSPSASHSVPSSGGATVPDCRSPGRTGIRSSHS